MRGFGFVAGLAVSLLIAEVHGQPTAARPPIIDMHMHAMPVDFYGKPPAKMCAPQNFPWVDPKDSTAAFMTCIGPMIQAGATDDEVIRRTVAVMTEYNVTGVISAPSRAGVSSVDRLKPWQSAAPDRVIPGVWSNGSVPLESIRTWAKEGRIRVLGELTFQYTGYRFADALPEQHFALAEELDLPVGLHVGPGAPGEAYFLSARYRAELGRPLALEESLLRHPKMRLYVMHAGWPLIDEMLALLLYHPQVNVDVGIISWQLPRAEFHRHLRRFIDAGFGKRVMFGSDQLLFPEMIRVAIENIESAEFLTAEQKRDIFYNNAARFLRLDQKKPSGE
jgi:predicted TIM-barrel fold metal-dependent hydrolase